MGPTVSEVLKASAPRFPDWFKSRIGEFGETSISLAERRELSMYGDERRGLKPGQIFGRKDTESAVAQASEVLTACKQLYAANKGRFEDRGSQHTYNRGPDSHE